jgi:hypothetical protein
MKSQRAPITLQTPSIYFMPKKWSPEFRVGSHLAHPLPTRVFKASSVETNQEATLMLFLDPGY